MLTLCKEHGFPIKEAFAPLETMATWCALQVDNEKLRQMNTTSEEFCRKLGDVLFNDKCSYLINRFIIVGEDIDVFDFQDIMWAFVDRCRPGQDEYIREDVLGFHLTPYMAHGKGDKRRGGKLISDCLFPFEYEREGNYKRVDFEHSYPESLKAKVRAEWRSMGFESSLDTT